MMFSKRLDSAKLLAPVVSTSELHATVLQALLDGYIVDQKGHIRTRLIAAYYNECFASADNKVAVTKRKQQLEKQLEDLVESQIDRTDPARLKRFFTDVIETAAQQRVDELS